jgi:hypothetical protein
MPTLTLTSPPTPTKTRLPPTKTRVPAVATTTAPPTVEATTGEPPPMTLISLTRDVMRGADATLVIQTGPGTTCGASYVSPGSDVAGSPDVAKFIHLGEITADADGRCQWTWNIALDTIPGTGQVSAGAAGHYAAWDIHITYLSAIYRGLLSISAEVGGA